MDEFIVDLRLNLSFVCFLIVVIVAVVVSAVQLCHLTAPIISSCNCNCDSCIGIVLISLSLVPSLTPSPPHSLYLSLSCALSVVCTLMCLPSAHRAQPVAQLKVTHYLF